MKERGILFSAPMVRALLAGAKTQTRRPVTRKGELVKAVLERPADKPLHPVLEQLCPRVACPYGVPGDRLWVREAYSPHDRGLLCAARDASYVVFADGGQKHRDGVYVPPLPAYSQGAFDGIKWKPSIHMPRWASRLTLEIEQLRIEHVQDISEDDARAEGVELGVPQPALINGERGSVRYFDPRHAFAALWDSINGQSARSWADNPLVWAITFRVVPQSNSQCHEAKP